MIFIDLYEFKRGATTWRYTSSTRAYLYSGNTYSPIAIGRGVLSTTDEVQKNVLDVSLDFRNDLASILIKTTDEIPATLTLYRSINGTVETWFKGTLSDIAADGAKCKLSFVNVFAKLKRQSLRRHCSRLCNLAVFGRECAANPLNFSKAATVVSNSGNTLIVSFGETFADGYFDTGHMIVGIVGASTDRTMVLSHVGNTITLKKPNPGATVGSTIHLVPGCDHKVSTCRDKFDNLYHYGGFPSLTIDNPFSSSDAL